MAAARSTEARAAPHGAGSSVGALILERSTLVLLDFRTAITAVSVELSHSIVVIPFNMWHLELYKEVDLGCHFKVT